MTVPRMLQHLSTATRTHHATADADRLAVMDVATRADYRAFLARVYGFEAPVEAALSQTPALTDVLHGRLKVDRLRQDLEMLGLTQTDIAQLPMTASPRFRSLAQALGWLFVIERHTLVSGVVRRHLQRTLHDGVGDAFNYFTAYRETVGARFRSLGEALGKYAPTCASHSIVTAANDAFRVQRQWYRVTVPAHGHDSRATDRTMKSWPAPDAIGLVGG